MAKKTVNPNQSIVLSGVLLLMLGFGRMYYFFMPQYTSAESDQVAAQSKKESLAADITTLQKAKVDISASEASLTAQGVDFSQIAAHFPVYEDVPGIYLQMEAILKNSQDVKLLTYQVGKPSSLNGQVEIPITLSGIAPYANLKNLLQRLQLAVRPVSITQLTLSVYVPDPSHDKDNIPANSYTLGLAGYIRAEQLSASYSTSK